MCKNNVYKAITNSSMGETIDMFCINIYYILNKLQYTYKHDYENFWVRPLLR